VIHVVRIGVRQSKLTSYRPDAEDWTWNVMLPLIAYAALAAGAIATPAAPWQALYGPAAAATLLIFIGIHNAWDVVTFLATGKAEQLANPAETPEARERP